MRKLEKFIHFQLTDISKEDVRLLRTGLELLVQDLEKRKGGSEDLKTDIINAYELKVLLEGGKD